MKILHREISYQQNKRTSCRMGEDVCKFCDLKGVNIQKNTKNSYNSTSTKPGLKMGIGSK